MIGRVKELLGLKSDDKPAPAGRAGHVAGAAPADKNGRSARRGRHVGADHHDAAADQAGKQLREQVRPRGRTRSRSRPRRRDPTTISTRSTSRSIRSISSCPAARRREAAPIRRVRSRRRAAPADPRSPGRAPSTSRSAAAIPIFEVDDEWFGDDDTPGPRRRPRRTPRDHRRPAAMPQLQAPADAERRRRRFSKSTTSGSPKATSTRCGDKLDDSAQPRPQPRWAFTTSNWFAGSTDELLDQVASGRRSAGCRCVWRGLEAPAATMPRRRPRRGADDIRRRCRRDRVERRRPSIRAH